MKVFQTYVPLISIEIFSLPRIPYSASKFAVRGLMEALYVELRQVGLDSISVFVVILGDFDKH